MKETSNMVSAEFIYQLLSKNFKKRLPTGFDLKGYSETVLPYLRGFLSNDQKTRNAIRKNKADYFRKRKRSLLGRFLTEAFGPQNASSLVKEKKAKGGGCNLVVVPSMVFKGIVQNAATSFLTDPSLLASSPYKDTDFGIINGFCHLPRGKRLLEKAGFSSVEEYNRAILLELNEWATTKSYRFLDFPYFDCLSAAAMAGFVQDDMLEFLLDFYTENAALDMEDAYRSVLSISTLPASPDNARVAVGNAPLPVVSLITEKSRLPDNVMESLRRETTMRYYLIENNAGYMLVKSTGDTLDVYNELSYTMLDCLIRMGGPSFFSSRIVSGRFNDLVGLVAKEKGSAHNPNGAFYKKVLQAFINLSHMQYEQFGGDMTTVYNGDFYRHSFYTLDDQGNRAAVSIGTLIDGSYSALKRLFFTADFSLDFMQKVAFVLVPEPIRSKIGSNAYARLLLPHVQSLRYRCYDTGDYVVTLTYEDLLTYVNFADKVHRSKNMARLVEGLKIIQTSSDYILDIKSSRNEVTLRLSQVKADDMEITKNQLQFLMMFQ